MHQCPFTAFNKEIAELDHFYQTHLKKMKAIKMTRDHLKRTLFTFEPAVLRYLLALVHGLSLQRLQAAAKKAVSKKNGKLNIPMLFKAAASM